PGDASYEQEVRDLAGADQRIQFAAPVQRPDVLRTVAGFDLLAVPSLVMETGPLVVLEAFAAGTAVIGSNLGGIAELVEPETSGRLVRAGDVEAWSRAIEDIAGSDWAWTRQGPL